MPRKRTSKGIYRPRTGEKSPYKLGAVTLTVARRRALGVLASQMGTSCQGVLLELLDREATRLGIRTD